MDRTNFTDRLCLLFAGVAMAVVLAGCSREYRIELFNFSAQPIVLDPSLGGASVGNALSTVLIDAQKRPFPLTSILRMTIDGHPRCYPLPNIKIGGYGEFDESNVLLVRLRLERDERIYVHRVEGRGFAPADPVGEQPPGYPVASDCTESP